MALKENFQANLRKRRRELGLTQKQLAEKLGVSHPYVSQLENGEQSPGLDVVERFAKALDCPSLMLLMSAESVLSNA